MSLLLGHCEGCEGAVGECAVEEADAMIQRAVVFLRATADRIEREYLAKNIAAALRDQAAEFETLINGEAE